MRLVPLPMLGSAVRLDAAVGRPYT